MVKKATKGTAKKAKKVVKKSSTSKSKSKPKKTETYKESPIFVGIPTPETLRRQLLESSKEFLIMLKKIEDLKKNQEEKQNLMIKVQSLLKEIKSLVSKLKKKLPSPAITKVVNSSKKKETSSMSSIEPISVKQVSKKSKKPMTELEKLEAELEMIESKLQTI